MNLSSTGTGSAKIGSWKMEKIGVLAIQKVAKTGNIGEKTPVAGNITSACRIKRDDA